ncbi:hypothetical protein F5Y10DRAFT_239549 [Nemania abortiva]|nr:hypothetical protein F5Y10DRAFT_239549 [Nemania abortiva]
MGSSERGSGEYSYSDDEGRAWVRESQGNNFCVGDEVYVKGSGGREGPYKVSSVPSTRRYTLSTADGTSARGGEEIDEDNLESA